MNRRHSPALVIAVAAAATFSAASASAQVSEDRLHELIREAQKVSQPTFAFTPKPPEGPTVPITIDDAVKFALERNLDLAVLRLTPELQDIAVATARTVYQPQLSSTIQRSSATTTPTSQLQVGASGGAVVSNNLAYNAAVNQQLPWWGSSFLAQFQNARTDSTSNNVTLNPQYQSTWTAQFTQPLLRDRKIDLARRTISITQINRDISDVQLKAQISNLAADVRSAYWDFVYTTQAVDVARQSLALATKLVEDNRIKVEVGTMAPIDIVQAQAEEARMRQSLVTAENLRRTAELTLKRLIVGGTDDPNWAATLDPVDSPDFSPETIDVEGAIRHALADRTDIDIVRKNIQANTVSLDYLRDATMPAVDLNVNYGVQGVGGTQLVRDLRTLGSPVTATIPGGIGDSFSSLLRASNPRWTVGVNITYPLGLSAQDTALARARVQLNQNQSQLKLLELKVTTDITNAAITLRNMAEAVQAARASRELSEQRLSAEQSKFEVGMSTNFQVVQAQRDLNDARNSELRAILDYQRAQVEFDRVQQNGAQANFAIIGTTGSGTGGIATGGVGGTGVN
jgi:outer membrane protein